MSNKAFRVEGDFQMGRQRQHFRIDVIGEDEEAARRAAYAELGSRHGVKQRLVDIGSVKALSGDDIGPVTRKRMER